jgi:copper(I)-binding protein
MAAVRRWTWAGSALALVACGQPDPHSQEAGAAVAIERPYAYTTPGSTELALYFVARNHGAQPDTLVHVQTPDAAGVMVHRYVREGDLVRMEHLPHLVLPARDSVVLEPGGLHLMLTQGRRPRGPGRTLHLSFRFSSGAIVTTTAPVLEPGAEPPPER